VLCTDNALVYDAAGSTYREIGAMLEARGIAPREKRWYPSSVRAVLQ
jgi:hypothetical protein